nr:methyltransferase [Sphingomonas quercus]
MGNILLHSGIREGDRVLEYGAGFGRNALAFARLGAKVDTVDVDQGFCQAVEASAGQYDVDLHAYKGLFGFNPAGHDCAYDLILFYESFHHAFNFRDLIPRLHGMLKAGGRLILAGEPIVPKGQALLPYDWGIRLDWQNVAVMRLRGWMELGFTQPYLMSLFEKAGFSWRLHDDPRTDKARLFLLRKD